MKKYFYFSKLAGASYLAFLCYFTQYYYFSNLFEALTLSLYRACCYVKFVVYSICDLKRNNVSVVL